MPRTETVEINGVIVDKGNEEAAAKWGKGAKVEKEFATEGVTYTEEDAIEQNDGKDVAPKKRGRKAK